MASKKQTIISRPLARTENLVVESVGDETVIYDTDAHVAHALKPLAAAVYAYADGKNTPAEIAELASYRLDSTVTEANVVDALEQLDAIALIEGPVLDVHTGISRRTALKTFAAAGAGSMLVMSIATAAAQACITCSTAPPDTYSCSTNNFTDQIPSGPVGPSGWQNGTTSDCRLCNESTGSSGGNAYPCQTTGSLGTCCCAPCDNTSSKNVYCCQPICLNTVSGTCPTGTIPLGHTVGGENGYPKVACPTGYGAYQAAATGSNKYYVKCCKEGTETNGVPNNDGSPYCECADSAGTCGQWVSTTSRGKTTYTCQIYT